MINRAIICLGMSLSLLIGIFVLWGGLPLVQATGMDISEILKYWSIPSVLAICLALSLTLLIKKLPSKRFLIGASVLAGVLLIGGFILLLLCGSLSSIQLFAVGASAAVTGFGYSSLLIIWQHHLSQLSREGVAKVVLLSLVICSIGYLLLSVFLPENSWYAFPVIVLVTIILSVLCVRLPALKENRMRPLESRGAVIKRTVVELRDPLLCVSAMAFAVALTRAIALDGIEDAGIVNLVSSLFIIVVSMVLYFIWFRIDSRRSLFGKNSIPGLYRICFPVIATALLALSIIGSALSLAVTTLVYVVFSLVSVLIMSTSIDNASKHEIWPSYVYGVFAGIIYLVFAAATALGAWVYYPKNFGAATFSIIVIVVLYMLAMSYVAIKNRKKRDEEDVQTQQYAASHIDSLAPHAANNNDGLVPRTETTVIDEVAQRCSILTTQNRLTVRESDTLLLLAKGRDVPSIAKQLFISENTVRSHSKAVYRKLEVHSKQELLDLLDTIELETHYPEE